MIFIILPIIILIIGIISYAVINSSKPLQITTSSTTNAPQITTTTNAPPTTTTTAIIRTPILTATPARVALFTNSLIPTNIRKITSPKDNYSSYLLYLNNDYTLGVYGKFNGTATITLPDINMRFKDIDSGFAFLWV